MNSMYNKNLLDELYKHHGEWEIVYDGKNEGNDYIPHSYVYKYNNYCIKKVVKYPDEFDVEVKYLTNLQKYDFVPRLLAYDKQKLMIVMEYISGTSINFSDCKKEFSEQKNKIDNLLRKEGIIFLDNKDQNYILKHNKVYRFDFGSCY